MGTFAIDPQLGRAAQGWLAVNAYCLNVCLALLGRRGIRIKSNNVVFGPGTVLKRQ